MSTDKEEFEKIWEVISKDPKWSIDIDSLNEHDLNLIWAVAYDAWQAARASQSDQVIAEYKKEVLYLRERVDELEGQSERAIPEGWALVPIEPSQKMQSDAAFNLCSSYEYEFVRDSRQMCLDAYRYLIGAAPQPPKDTNNGD